MSATRIEDVNNPVIGRFYLVPTVFNRSWKLWVPIHGPEHEDAKFINFEDVHWHIDWRFASSKLWRLKTWPERPEYMVHASVTNANLSSAIELHRTRMAREMPHFVPENKIPWLKKLEEAFCFQRLPKCLTCPHKGISLKQFKPDEHGVVTCPGHGLSWNVNTGYLVRST